MPDATLAVSADLLARGVCRAVEALGYAALTEFPLGNGRRVDVIAVAGGGETLIVEIKSSVAALPARRKWMEYLPDLGRLYIAGPGGVAPPNFFLWVGRPAVSGVKGGWGWWA